MLVPAHLISSVVYRVRFTQNGGYFGLIDGGGIDYLFFAELRESDGVIVLNDQIGGQWGRETYMSSPRHDDQKNECFMELKFNSSNLEIWSPFSATEFLRFDALRARSVRFAKFAFSVDEQNALYSPLHSVDRALSLIDSHIAYKRMERFEKILGIANPRKSDENE